MQKFDAAIEVHKKQIGREFDLRLTVGMLPARATAAAQYPHRKSCFHSASVDFHPFAKLGADGRCLRAP